MVFLKLEDYIYAGGPKHEYINSNRIFRVRATRKRIKIYTNTGIFNYIFVEKNEHNLKEIELKLGVSL